jgi:hypothetical protein
MLTPTAGTNRKGEGRTSEKNFDLVFLSYVCGVVECVWGSKTDQNRSKREGNVLFCHTFFLLFTRYSSNSFIFICSFTYLPNPPSLCTYSHLHSNLRLPSLHYDKKEKKKKVYRSSRTTHPTLDFAKRFSRSLCMHCL